MTITFKVTTVDENEIKYKDFKIEEFIRSQIELKYPILGPEQIYKKLVESGCDEEKACDMVEKIQIDNEEKRQKKIKKKLEKIEILKTSCDPTNLKIVQTNVNNNNSNNISDCGGNNSFVYSAWSAYNNHSHLVLRPDNIWIQIVTQFSIYINKNSKYFKDKLFDFDHHEVGGAGIGNGKHHKEHHHHNHNKGIIHISTNYPILEAPYEKLVGDLANQISLNIKDSTVRDWIIPNFTTTTPSDKVVYSSALMATMKENLVYKVTSACGLPKITLNGVPEDWINLRERVLKLREYDIGTAGDVVSNSSTGSLGGAGGQMNTWVNLLLPIMNKFVETSQGKPDIDWWNQIVDHRSRPSGGSSVLSGWLSVFCIFKNDGTFRGEHQHSSSNGNGGGNGGGNANCSNGDLGQVNKKGSNLELGGKKKGSNLDLSRKNSGIDLGKNNNNNNNSSGNLSNNGSSGNLDPSKANNGGSLNNLATTFSLKSSTGSLGNGSNGSLGGGNNWPRISDSSIANGFGSCPLILTNSDGTKFHSEIYSGHLGVKIEDRTKLSPSLDWLIIIDNEIHEKNKCVIN